MRIRRFVLFYCLLFYAHQTLAQGAAGSGSTPAAKPNYIDVVPGKQSQNLPFDSAFTLGIHLPSKEAPYTTYLVRMKSRDQSPFASYSRYVDGYKSFGQRVGEDGPWVMSLENNYADIVQGKDSIFKVHFRQTGYPNCGVLKPNRRYALVMTKQLLQGVYDTAKDNGLLTTFYRAFNADGTVDDDRKTTAQNDYNALRKKQLNTTGKLTTLLEDFGIPFTFYKCTIYPLHKQYFDLRTAVDSNTDIAAALQKLNGLYDAGCLIATYRWLAQQACPGKDHPARSCCDSICKVLPALQALSQLQPADLQKLVTGENSLQDFLKSHLDVKSAAKDNDRAKNIQSSLRDIMALAEAIYGNSIVTEEQPCTNAFFAALSACLEGRANNISKMASLKRQIYNLLTGGATNVYFAGLEVDNMDTYVLNFQTRAGLYFTPVFGYAVYKFGSTYDFSPYLGFQVNFEPMNTAMPFAQQRGKTLLQRLSFTTAWTLKSVSSPGKRQDFFGNSSSLMTGLGFKLSHFLMINVSSLWFKRLDPNPYSTAKTIVTVPALSLSLNLTAKDILNGFTSLIPSL
jgi:hypothetical protein